MNDGGGWWLMVVMEAVVIVVVHMHISSYSEFDKDECFLASEVSILRLPSTGIGKRSFFHGNTCVRRIEYLFRLLVLDQLWVMINLSSYFFTTLFVSRRTCVDLLTFLMYIQFPQKWLCAQCPCESYSSAFSL